MNSNADLIWYLGYIADADGTHLYPATDEDGFSL